jgi:hypothetical protein
MFNFFRKRRIKKYIEEASAYVQQKYVVPVQPPESTPTYPDGVRFSLKRTQPSDSENKVRYSDRDDGIRYSLSDEQEDDIRYSDRETDVLYSEKDEPEAPPSDVSYSLKEKSSSDVRYSLKEKPSEDHYNASAVSGVLRNYSTARNYNEMLKTLEQNVNQTFVDRMLYYINAKGVRDSEVYKAAQVDKRLFSKIVSNNEYKPSKDTAIALALALELSLDEASDLLSRAGYTFSHSNKRDIIIEFFFREKVYNLIDVNEVLFSLNQKLIGRF